MKNILRLQKFMQVKIYKHLENTPEDKRKDVYIFQNFPASEQFFTEEFAIWIEPKGWRYFAKVCRSWSNKYLKG